MEIRLIYLGKSKCKELDNDFDYLFDLFKIKAKSKGYNNPKLKFIKEKSNVKVYVEIDIDNLPISEQDFDLED